MTKVSLGALVEAVGVEAAALEVVAGAAVIGAAAGVVT
jgi:hypothetical protein